MHIPLDLVHLSLDQASSNAFVALAYLDGMRRTCGALAFKASFLVLLLYPLCFYTVDTYDKVFHAKAVVILLLRPSCSCTVLYLVATDHISEKNTLLEIYM